MPLIRIVSTGGTIANTSGGLIDINDVLKAVPQAAAYAELEVVEATRVRSASMRLPQWLDIARTVKEAADAAQATPGPGLETIFSDVYEEVPDHIRAQGEAAFDLLQRKGDAAGGDGEFPL